VHSNFHYVPKGAKPRARRYGKAAIAGASCAKIPIRTVTVPYFRELRKAFVTLFYGLKSNALFTIKGH